MSAGLFGKAVRVRPRLRAVAPGGAAMSAVIATALLAWLLAAPGRAAAQVTVSSGVEIASRSFTYRDAIVGRLRPHEVAAAPLGVVGVTVDAGLPVSLACELSRSAQLSSDLAGVDVGSVWSRGEAALVARPLPWLAVFAGAGREAFSFDRVEAWAELPDVAYAYARGGATASAALGPVSGHLTLGVRRAFSSGALGERLRDASVVGADASAGASLPLGGGFSATFDARYVRWAWTFSPEPGDAYVAGGALDHSFGARAGFAFEVP